MRSVLVLASVAVLIPVVACQVDYGGYGYGQPPVQAQVQVQTPPPPQATVVVDPNAQQQPIDPNAQATDPNQQAATDQVADTDPSAIGDFRDVLAPYGTWSDDPQYGTVWFPNPGIVGGDFQPYVTAGHWVYDNDYTWVSDYDWGWAPFHYGRWFSYPGRGWAWIPGKEYAGAWVTWRNGDDGYGYVGWAPTPPSFYWRGGVAVNLPQPWFQPSYQYVDTGSLFQPTFRANIIRDRGRIATIEQRTRPYMPSGTVVVGGNTRMMVRGPAPMRLGLNASVLPRAPANNASMARAYQFSHTRGGQPVNVNRTVTPYHPPINPVQRTDNRVEERPVNAQQMQQQGGRPDDRMHQAPMQQQQQVHVDDREHQYPAQMQQQQRPVTPTPSATNVRRVTPAETHERRR